MPIHRLAKFSILSWSSRYTKRLYHSKSSSQGHYDDWVADIQTALEACRKFGFLDGTIPKHVPPCTQSGWDTNNVMLVSRMM